MNPQKITPLCPSTSDDVHQHRSHLAANDKKKGLISICLLALMLAVTGCAGTSVKPETIHQLTSVSVSHSVELSPEVSYHGPEQSLGAALGGILGALIAQGATSSPDQIKTYLAEQHIDVGEIVRQAFVEGLQHDSRFANKIKESAENHFELEVPLYGLAQNGGFSSEYKAWLGFRARLIDPSGNVIWEKYDFVTHFNDAVPAAKYAAYFESPEQFRIGFKAAAAEITKMLLQKM
ncbi:hypothetical protein E4T66_14650 [Sinimarinibacterium sp. CAU 1509]|uniref:hypothetical protein n=1 Tax=Sinimarinibacterium sp. CAU 1509 TaxID=2562283 RepID=UPI0010AC8359|nr:hypothetical protein [Sinimarinibacterium sp. CAU 1509]TJY58838.1 hypothetical protein E4T66_14650 [Sinimarinibacterium sp. CAU 1509]